VTVAKRIVVSGRVQGVFFRDSCRQEASRLGISGSARNLSDGTVEVIAEGDEEAVDALINWCREGPSHADVDSVDVSDAEVKGASGFKTS
jgi:acylphosphatase